MSQLERDTNRTGGEAVVEEEEEEEKERKEEEEEEKERQEEEEDEGREEREVTDYGGGRFAGVGEFAPALQKASNIARAALPVFKQNPEASLRYQKAMFAVMKISLLTKIFTNILIITLECKLILVHWACTHYLHRR